MVNAIFKMTLVTEQPMSITLPVVKGARPNSFENSPMMTRGLDGEGKRLQTCYIPATTFRGMLRRHAVIPKMEARAEANNPYKLPEAYADLIGQDPKSEQQANEIDLVALKKQRESNPVIDLFGLGLGVQSRLKVSHFLPPENIYPEQFTTARKDIGDHEDGRLLDLLPSEEIPKYIKRSTANSKKSKAETTLEKLEEKVKKEGGSKDLDLAIKETKKKIAQYTEEMDGMENSSKGVFGFYAMPQGVEWSGRLVVTNYRDRDMEMICNALDRFSHYPMLGAQHARGCGEISGQADVSIDGTLVKKISFGGFEAAKIDDF